jgi:hypothetical protein
MLDGRSWMLDAGCWMPDDRCQSLLAFSFPHPASSIYHHASLIPYRIRWQDFRGFAGGPGARADA